MNDTIATLTTECARCHVESLCGLNERNSWICMDGLACEARCTIDTAPTQERELQGYMDEIDAMQQRMRAIGRNFREINMPDAWLASEEAHTALHALWARLAWKMSD